MKNVYLQTVMTTCGACNSILDIRNFEQKIKENIDFFIILNVVCHNCNKGGNETYDNDKTKEEVC